MAKRYYNYRSTSSSAPPDLPDTNGGGDAPAWVPANAKIHIDLVGGTPQGRAWVQGTGEVAVNTLFGSDANATSAWGETTGYNPANLTANGYVSASAVALIGASLAAVVAAVGFTLRIQTRQVTILNNAMVFALMSADGADAIVLDSALDLQVRATSWGGSLNCAVSGAVISGAGALNAYAMTLVPGRIDVAANGSTAATAVVGSSDRPPGNPLVSALSDIGSIYALQSITLYDPLPDTTGLSELSQVGA